MQVLLRRLKSDSKATLGFMDIDDDPMFFTLEDAHHDTKIMHETRIPAGEYEIKLRNDGGMNKKYTDKFGHAFHKGMLHLQNVPNYKWIYIHFGNRAEHTSGCVLVGTIGDLTEDNKSIGRSVDAYKKIYARISLALLDGEKVTIKILDE